MGTTAPFQTLFSVPMTCDGCVKAVSESLSKINGVSTFDVNLKDQLVFIEGTAPPSVIVQAIQATGRDAILRGSGVSDSAAVCILETFSWAGKNRQVRNDGSDRHVRGLARMVQVSSTATLVDLTLRGVSAGTYRATIREFGDVKDGAQSAGPIWAGSIEVGVIARSAGMWDNDKTVCSCTGKTLWEERKDEVKKASSMNIRSEPHVEHAPANCQPRVPNSEHCR
ncbi:hypothetical protein P8C59_006686 [Phyllachora maydis]|uniref:Superoxide dismutase 1 copper chaperone n=1 Tax=Phyllachora maydis TaxID=1825666 RepID=A0AAD9I8P5_9PEZI|nr:hypothetical protein P8C59_006686 [Phyllachora maydis]